MTYWRGRVWPNVNYLVWLGLQRAGQAGRAARLAAQGYDLFRRSWCDDRIASENYNAETGEAIEQGDTDPFYTWSALLPLMAVEEICGFTPWDGWCLTNGPDCRLGPLNTPLGPTIVLREGGMLRLSCGDILRFETDFPGQLSRLRFDSLGFSCSLSASDRRTRLSLPAVAASSLISAELDGAPLACDPRATITLPPGGPDRSLRLWFRP